MTCSLRTLCGSLGLILCACNGGTTGTGSGTTSTSSSSSSSSSTATASSFGSSSSTGDSSGSGTVAETSSTSTSTSTGEPTTSGSTGPLTSGSSTGSSGSTSDGCICQPGEPIGECDGEGMVVCADDCLTYDVEPCAEGELCLDGTCVSQICTPGSKSCADEQNYVVCDDDGQDWGESQPCAADEGCLAGECLSLCELIKGTPSSIGCSFVANRMDNFDNNAGDSVVVGNTSESHSAKVQLYFTPNNSNTEKTQGGLIDIAPGMTHIFTMSNVPMDKVSRLRQGGSYRIESDIPIIAYQHSPIGQDFTNDASMLLPEHALKQNYVLAAYKASLNGFSDYFNVIALEDGTKVEWTPTANTIAGSGVSSVKAGATGSVMMNRHDTLQVRGATLVDLSGTLVNADKPIWVVSAVECVNVPAGVSFCDHIEEQMLPLDYWGKKYVGAPSPKRGSEDHHWRVFGGADGVTVSTDPVQSGTPFTLDKGQFKELVVSTGTAFIFEGDGPFLPVQYLESQNGGAATGDPSMYQMVPVEQFLTRYAFVTGTSYPLHYAQIIRPLGAADVSIDGDVVGGFYSVGDFEVADVKITEGAHLAVSDDPFGIVGLGYSAATSYAYPGGMRLKVLNPQ